MATTKRLEILKVSLIKKQALLDQKFSEHFATVAQANGQPLNDKRNGQATLNKWERQNEALRKLQKSIEATKNAIEREEGKITEVESAKDGLPKEILSMVEAGELIQWRKHPNTFFVPNVDKARIIWDTKKKIIAHRFATEVKDQEQYSRFAKAFNALRAALIEAA